MFNQGRTRWQIEQTHQGIMVQGSIARRTGVPFENNPYSESASKGGKLRFDPKKKESWEMGWLSTDRQIETESQRENHD